MHNEIKGTELPSVMALAFLGDARHTLYIRRMLVLRGHSKSGVLNDAARQFVTAEAQAKMMRKIEPLLLPDELLVYKRAANSPHLNKPKHARLADYRAATGFEAVIGMLDYIGDGERLELLLNTAYTEIEENDTEN